MKFTTFVAAAAFSVLGATASFAQINTNTVVQDGKHNSSTTRQRGHDNLSEKAQFCDGRRCTNKSSTQQRGDINTSSTGQVATGGGSNTETTDQRGRRERFNRR